MSETPAFCAVWRRRRPKTAIDAIKKAANQAERQTNGKQQHRLDRNRKRRIAVLYAVIRIADVAARAHIAALAAGDAFSHADIALIGLYRDRTIFCARRTAVNAVGAIARISSNHRKQRKNRAHRAQELAEKAFFYRHAYNNGKQKHNRNRIARRNAARRGQHREYIPRAPARQLIIHACRTQNDNDEQNQILDLLQVSGQLVRHVRQLLFRLFLNKLGQLIYRIAKRAEGAGIAAEKPAADYGVQTYHHECREKRAV